MNEPVKSIDLEVSGRHRDVRIGIEGTGHGNISFKLSGNSGKKEPYEGPYSVESVAREAQIYQTENKVMTENLIVLPIPYYETSNPQGGLTVYIGGD